MKQQINLYKALYPSRKRWPLSKRATTIAGLVLCVSFGLIGFSSWKIYDLKQQYQFELNAKSIKEASFKQMRKEANESIKKDQQNADLAALKAEFKSKTYLNQQLEKQMARSTGGYLNYFVALARQDVRGIWLNQIKLGFDQEQEVNSITLGGETVEPSLITRYLGKLSREKSFAGVSFSEMQIEPLSKKAGKASSEFLVSTHQIENTR